MTSWGQHGAHLGPVVPRWAPCWPCETCYPGLQCCASPHLCYQNSHTSHSFTVTLISMVIQMHTIVIGLAGIMNSFCLPLFTSLFKAATEVGMISIRWWPPFQHFPYLIPVKLTHLPLDKMAAILADSNFKCIFLNENHRIPIWISLKFVLRSPVDNKPALVQVMAWRQTGDKP